MTEKQEFHPSAVISAITGKLLCHNGMEDVYKLLSHLRGYPVFTHQIPQAIRDFQEYLTEKFPELANESTLGVNRDTFPEWLAGIESRHGKSIEVTKPKTEENEA